MIGEILNNRYRIIDNFSAGMFGQTYLAEDISFPDPRKCIVRRLQIYSKGSEVLKYIHDMLRATLESLSAVNNHDQIPSVLDYFDGEDSFYLVEEYIDGHPLSEELEPHKPLDEPYVIEIMCDALKTLAFMHSHLVIHQCIQPTTLIRRHSDNKLVLTGSGMIRKISGQLLESQTQPYQHLMMHPSTTYIPIEQLNGHPQFSSDIYALGMVAIQALSGLPVNVLSRIKHQNGTLDEQLSWQNRVNASPALVRILERMVHPDHMRRYQTANEVLHDLEALATTKLPSESIKSSEDVLDLTSTEPELELMVDESDDDSQATSSPEPKLLSLPLLAGAVALMVIGGTVLALLGRQLPAAFSSANSSTNSTTSQGRQPSSSSNQGISEQAIAVDKLIKEGQDYLRKGKPRDALSRLTQAIQLDPKNATAYYLRGDVRMELGDRQSAISDYSEAIGLDANLVAVYVKRGNAKADLGDDQGAIADYTEAITRDGKLSAAYLNRCLSYSNIGEQDKAISDCTQAINLQPDDVFAYQNRGLSYRRQGKIQLALQDLNTAINLDRNDADLYYNRGVIRHDLGDYQGAILDYTKAIELRPSHALVYYDRALAKIDLDDREGALSDLHKAATLCLDAGRINCYNDAQYHIKQLQAPQ
ncbi:MAG: tetratricopeptide repeat protein [Cyanobacteria bacterium]|nr:tetratricopeptide repeat protein [Cyanobacteriota bacterium]MDW8199860.1 tetratricopeptide repeat protein [Cyanobacteriota bacterium SKYGB_h_bin112]